jgi:hypothetical protein
MVASEAVQLFQGFAGGVTAAKIIHNHIGAALGKFEGDAFAYAFCPPGYKGSFALKILTIIRIAHYFPPLYRSVLIGR